MFVFPIMLYKLKYISSEIEVDRCFSTASFTTIQQLSCPRDEYNLATKTDLYNISKTFFVINVLLDHIVQ